jgi:AcrR family transcriptional regulator
MTVVSAKRRPGRPARTDLPAAAADACLDRALEAFAERGFEGASIREIAAASGVSHGLLNVRFGSKMGLWIAAVDHGHRQLGSNSGSMLLASDFWKLSLNILRSCN